MVPKLECITIQRVCSKEPIQRVCSKETDPVYLKGSRLKRDVWICAQSGSTYPWKQYKITRPWKVLRKSNDTWCLTMRSITRSSGEPFYQGRLKFCTDWTILCRWSVCSLTTCCSCCRAQARIQGYISLPDDRFQMERDLSLAPHLCRRC